MKVIPFGSEVILNESPLLKASEIVQEAVITKKVTELNGGSQNFNFIRLLGVVVCEGAYPVELLDEWDKYDTLKESENDRPGIH